MPQPVTRILENFPLMSPSLFVADARRQLYEAARLQAINIGYGVVVDAEGLPLTCLSTTTIEGWPGDLTLEAMRHASPILLTLLRKEIHDSDRDIYLVASFFRDEISSHDNFVGIILLDEQGRPNGLVRKRVLLEAIAGMRTRYYNREYPQGLPPGIPAERELMVTRYGQLDFPQQVQLNYPCQLIITIKLKPPSDETQYTELGLRKEDWPLEVVVTLLGVNEEDFLVKGAKSGVIEVPRTDDSQPLIFTLIPKSLGKKVICVLFEQNNTHLAGTVIHTEAVSSVGGSIEAAQVNYPPQLQEKGEPPDITIYIKRRQGLTYDVSMRTAKDTLGREFKVDQIDFPQRPDLYLDAIFEDLNTKTKTGLTPTEYDEEVKKIGWNLFEKLFHNDTENPERSFKSFYWQEMHTLPEGSTVQLISEEPFIPWELLRPTRRKDDGSWEDEPFLCQRFALSRWRVPGPGSVSRISLLQVSLVAPPSNLRWVQQEVDAITQMKGLNVSMIKDKQHLEQFLKQQGKADVLHFACHGKYRSVNPGRSEIVLGNDIFRPNDIAGYYHNFGSSRPLVFLNACDSGREGIGLVGLDGWATAFLDSYVGFFIGSVWKTTDELACKFAKVFYAYLQENYPVGEAVRAARKVIEKAGDATYLSYTVYANPRAQYRESSAEVQRGGQ